MHSAKSHSQDRERTFSLKQEDFQAASKLYFSGLNDLSAMLCGYIEGVGAFDDWTYHSARLQIDSIACSEGLIKQGESLFDPLKVPKDLAFSASKKYPSLSYPFGLPEAGLTKICLLQSAANEYFDPTLPSPPAMLMKSRQRPSVNLYSCEVVHAAELLSHPLLFQLQSRNGEWYVPSASSRPLSKIAYSNIKRTADILEFNRPVVIIQDRFPGSNFAHYLFDWVPRVALYAEHCESEGRIDELKSTQFVMGGMPGDFEHLILENLCQKYFLLQSQFLFPRGAVVLKTSHSIRWFSDLIENYMHPALLCHPKAISVIKDVVQARSQVEGRKGAEKIYISRADASQRRISNEDELYSLLKEQGFARVTLSELPIADQMDLFSNASTVVAPHGMGLTHLTCCLPGTNVVELHHPGAGTDAYAFTSIANSLRYHAVFGAPTDGAKRDFRVDAPLVNAIVRAVCDIRTEQSSLVGSNGAATNQGTSLKIESPTKVTEQRLRGHRYSAIPSHPFVYSRPGSSSLFVHIRSNQDDTNVGYWTDVPVEVGVSYKATCLVWIPNYFNGSRIELSMGEWEGQQKIIANLKLREEWQEISTLVRSPSVGASCNLVLRAWGQKASAVFSSHWKLEQIQGQ